jgi:hypothetical protein
VRPCAGCRAGCRLAASWLTGMGRAQDLRAVASLGHPARPLLRGRDQEVARRPPPLSRCADSLDAFPADSASLRRRRCRRRRRPPRHRRYRRHRRHSARVALGWRLPQAAGPRAMNRDGPPSAWHRATYRHPARRLPVGQATMCGRTSWNVRRRVQGTGPRIHAP